MYHVITLVITWNCNGFECALFHVTMKRFSSWELLFICCGEMCPSCAYEVKILLQVSSSLIDLTKMLYVALKRISNFCVRPCVAIIHLFIHFFFISSYVLCVFPKCLDFTFTLHIVFFIFKSPLSLSSLSLSLSLSLSKYLSWNISLYFYWYLSLSLWLTSMERRERSLDLIKVRWLIIWEVRNHSCGDHDRKELSRKTKSGRNATLLALASSFLSIFHYMRCVVFFLD